MRSLIAILLQFFFLIALIQLVQPLIFLPILESFGIESNHYALFTSLFLLLGFYFFLSFGFIIEISAIIISLISVPYVISRLFSLTPKEVLKTQVLFFMLCFVILFALTLPQSFSSLLLIILHAHFELSFFLLTLGGLLGAKKTK